jgi:hypothetical protein
MSFVEGATIRDFLARRPSREVLDRVGRRLLELFLYQIHGLHALHADPHPGNYLFDDDGGIGLVDFGCVTRLSPALPEVGRTVIDGLWKEGDEKAARLARLIWGARPSSGSARTRRLLRAITDFYEMLFPPAGSGTAIVDFRDPALLAALTGNFRKAFRDKLTNTEFVFAGRAELGLLNLLHGLGARVDTRKVWDGVKGRPEVKVRAEPPR